MKFTLSWLKTHLETDADLATLTNGLTNIGLELESLEDRGAALAAFRVAHVIEATQHPNADRLRVCAVDAGDGIVSVVCGAPNARTGMKGVFAPPGSVIPSTGIVLQIGEIRGVSSAGMLLSLREMGLGEDHSGIVDLPEDAPIGMPYNEYAGLDDPVIEISVTPNRGDALSVRGVARDLAAAGFGTLKPLCPIPVPPRYDSRLRWAIAMPAACPWALGRAIRGVRNGPSPPWLRDRLASIGLRPINALVDITNFFTIDLGRPLHVFDAGKVIGDTLTFRPGAHETFRALNGRDYTATPEDCVIADASGAQSLAGVIGGEATGCDEATTEVFVECALFDPVHVAMTGRRHQIVSDARQRFERGIDPALMPGAIEAATRMILDLCGGEPSEIVSAGAEPAWARTATMRFDAPEKIGGLAVPADESVALLERLGFTLAARDGTTLTVNVPSWRNDIAGGGPLDQSPTLAPDRAVNSAEGRNLMEPAADLVEEILRLKGLDSIPPVSMPPLGPVPPPTLSPRQSRESLARRVLATRGLMECVTFSFMAAKHAALFGSPEFKDGDPALHLANPIASDLDQMRPTPIATLALAARRNAARGLPDAALFEIGPAFRGTTPEAQLRVASGLRAGATPRHWREPSRAPDVFDARGDALAVLAALCVPMDALATTVDAPGFYHPGRSGLLRQGPRTILASFGELHPRVLAELDLAGPIAAFEIYLDAIADPKRRRKGAPDMPAFQPLRRDFAFVVAAATPAESLSRAARNADRTLIAAVALFDVYDLGDGRKSLGLEFTLQPRDHTLTDAEIEAASAKVIAAVGKATGATLR